ncbi:hypothetical protein KY358_01390 [Candidatus Woesearchaeota archaeon]|nr:hypothetical protein [Candidatus Woesearchaeota archaeon]
MDRSYKFSYGGYVKKMKKLHKKGISFYPGGSLIPYIIFGIALSIMLIIFMLAIYNQVESSASIPEGIEEFSYIERFFSDDCFALDRINNPKTIEFSRFTEENLHSCYDVGDKSKKIAFKLELKLPKEKKIGPKVIRSRNWDEKISTKRKTMKMDISYNNEIIGGELIISEQNA